MTLFQIEFWFLLFLPGFSITFLIAWVRSRGKSRFLKIAFWATLGGVVGALIAFGCLSALFNYMLGDRVVDHFTTPLSVAQARQQDCPIPLPDSARNVQFAYASGGLQALEILVRFEAPVEVCRAQVQIVSDSQAKKMSWSLDPLPLTPLKSTPQPEENDMVGRAPWFDIERIAHGSTAGTGIDWAPQFWIDEDRGIFYCKITD